MKLLKFIIKTFLILLIYLLIYSLAYAIYINKTYNNINIIITLIFNSLGFLILGFCYGNNIQKRGLIIGLLTAIIHFIIIKLLYYFGSNIFEINALKTCILILSGGIGGLLGGNIKKIF